ALRSRLLRGARRARGPPLRRLRHGREEDPRRRRRHRPRQGGRPHRLRLRPRLHRLRRFAVGDLRAEGLQGDGPRAQGRRADGRPQRLGRRPHPGGGRLARRLRRHLPANTLASGVIPQISLILGPCAGGAVYSPAITDFILMADRGAYAFITGPDVIKTVLHEEISKEELGGAAVHASVSGVAHFRIPTDESAIALARELLSFLPSNNQEDAPRHPTQDPPHREEVSLDTLVPADPSKPYDIKQVITKIVDEGHFLEVHREYAGNLVVGFARLGGRPVGIVANQPNYLAGVLDIKASLKGARFVRFCDAFNIPVITFEDVPGFLPGREQEHGAIILHGAKLL